MSLFCKFTGHALPKIGGPRRSSGGKVVPKPTPAMLRTLKRNAVKPGMVLNPFGQAGYSEERRKALGPKPIWREAAMRRKRLLLKEKKAIALEAHELQQMARESATLAMGTLIEISKNKRAPEATRIAASSVILDRAYGKASQTSITANVTNGKASEITGDELSKRIDQALKRVEGLTKRTPEAGPSETRPPNLRKYN